MASARPSQYRDRDRIKSTKSPVVSVASIRSWSQAQRAIFDWFECPNPSTPHLVVRARAGTGKTTTILQGVSVAPERHIMLASFGKRIADTLNERLDNEFAEARTLHSLGLQAINERWHVQCERERFSRAKWLTNTALENMPVSWVDHRVITQLHSKARELNITTDLEGLAHFFDLIPEDLSIEDAAVLAARAVEIARMQPPLRSTGVDYADMIFLPLAWNLINPEFGLVVIDEAQDLTKAQLDMAQQSCQGRICLVGDDRQAIYAFRGADTTSLDRLKTALNAHELPLTITYRCGKKIVEYAKTLVPDFEVGPSNPPGLIDTANYAQLFEIARVGDFVLSRLNAPLASITLQLLRQGTPARMLGRDIGKGLMEIIYRLKVLKTLDVISFVTVLDRWEQERLKRIRDSSEADKLRDRVSTLRVLASGEEIHTVADIGQRCEMLFVDEPGQQVVCSSVHKAKGLEADRVFVLQESLYRREVSQEEHNIEYVAVTRAKSHLTWVKGVPELQKRHDS